MGDNNNHFNASWERCGTCHYWGGERRIEFINGIARWIYCRKNEPCPRRNGVPRNCLQRICEFYRKWIDLP